MNIPIEWGRAVGVKTTPLPTYPPLAHWLPSRLSQVALAPRPVPEPDRPNVDSNMHRPRHRVRAPPQPWLHPHSRHRRNVWGGKEGRGRWGSGRRHAWVPAVGRMKAEARMEQARPNWGKEWCGGWRGAGIEARAGGGEWWASGGGTYFRIVLHVSILLWHKGGIGIFHAAKGGECDPRIEIREMPHGGMMSCQRSALVEDPSGDRATARFKFLMVWAYWKVWPEWGKAIQDGCDVWIRESENRTCPNREMWPFLKPIGGTDRKGRSRVG